VTTCGRASTYLEARFQLTVIRALLARHHDGPAPKSRIGTHAPRPAYATRVAGHLRDEPLRPRRARLVVHDDRAIRPWSRADGQGRIGEWGSRRCDRNKGNGQVGRLGSAKLEAD